MLKYELVMNTDDELVYKYYPEGEGEPGIVSIKKNSMECELKQLAPEDEDNYYANHMWDRLRRFVTEGNCLQSGMIAWY